MKKMMENSNFEKTKGFVSKIPVRTIKPPSRLPVPIAAKDTESRKNHTKPNPSQIKNVSSKAQVKITKSTLVAPTKRLPSSQHTGFSIKGSVKAVTNRKLTNNINTTVNKKSTNCDLQTKLKVAKVSNQPANCKLLNTKIATENKRLTNVGSQNHSAKLASDKINGVSRRYTNISNKRSTLLNQKPTVVQRNFKNPNLTKEIEIKRPSNFGFRNNQKKELEIKQANEKLPCKGSTLTCKVADNKDTKVELKCKKDVSFDQKSDRPFSTQDPLVGKKNEEENHFSQAEIEFVADERYRNQILFGQGISPNLKHQQPVKNSLISDRPSFFLKSKTALRALERLEEEGRRVSMMRMSGMKISGVCPTILRNSPASRIDPIQGVLRALENVDLEAEDRRVSTMRKNNMYLKSPCRDNSPMFKPPQINPYRTALKKIEALQMKRKAKSTKKVTFNLEPSDAASKVSKQREALNIKSFEKVQGDDIMEIKKDDNQCPVSEIQIIVEDDHCSISEIEPKRSTPELQLSANPSTTNMERNVTQSHYNAMLLRICGQGKAQTKPELHLQHTTCSDGQSSEPNLQNFSSAENIIYPPKSMLLLQNASKISSNISDSVGPCFRTANRITSSILPSEYPRYLLQPQTVLTGADKRVNTVSTINNESSPLKSILQQNAAKTGSNIYDFIGPCLKNRNQITSSLVTSEDPRLSLYQSRPQTALFESDTRRSTLPSFSLSSIKNKSCPPKSFVAQNATKIAPNVSDSVGPGFRNRNILTSSIMPSEDPRFSLYMSRPQTVLESDTRRSTLSSYNLSTTKHRNSPPKSFLRQQNAAKISDSVGPCLNRITSSINASEDPRCSLSRPQNIFESSTRRNTLSRLCTPKPISFFPKPCPSDSISPEFLCRRTSQIVAHAPICTPMAMRTLAANLEETLSPLEALNEDRCSPICQRLDFDEIGKDNACEHPNMIPKYHKVTTLINLEETFSLVAPEDEECRPVCQRLDFDEIEKGKGCEAFHVSASPNKVWKFPIQVIRTNQQIVDSLADEECGTILSIASYPFITQRSVLNPVAQILTHGDDMHFVPLKLK